MGHDHPGRTLAAFAAALRVDDIPPAVLDRAADLMIDWFGSALARGRSSRSRASRSSWDPSAARARS
jgi:2-methylcitrate dehydratase PrpD